MNSWLEQFRVDPTEVLLASNNPAIEYFTNRDILDKKVKPIRILWELPEVQKVLKKQLPDGSWSYPGKRLDQYPKHHYSLLQTWKEFRILVERYELNKKHLKAKAAAEFLFSCQTKEGDIRGMIGNQYATYYTGTIMADLIQAGYTNDPRIERSIRWLLSMRQEDGAWTIPILTHKFDRETQHRLTSRRAKPVEPDRTKPFSHNWTDMVLRAFAAHPKYRNSNEAKHAGELLKSQFFQPDAYTSYRSPEYWVRFGFWWPNLLTSLESLVKLGFTKDDNKKGDKEKTNEKTREEMMWITLRIYRVFKEFF
jgi:hypothetical protein